MNKANIVPIVGISVLILCTAFNAARDRRPVPTPTPAPAAQQVVIYRTEGEIVAGMEKKLEELYPGRWELSRYASGEHTVVDGEGPGLGVQRGDLHLRHLLPIPGRVERGAEDQDGDPGDGDDIRFVHGSILRMYSRAAASSVSRASI